MSNGRRVDTAVVERVTEGVDVVGVDTGEVGVERALERGRVDTVDAVHLLAPLHGTAVDVPEPPAGVGQRLGVAQAGLGLGQRGLRQALLGQVARHADDAAARPVGVADRTERHRDRDAHAVTPGDLGLDVVDARPAGDRVEQHDDVVADVLREEIAHRRADDVLGVAAEDALGTPVPRDDAPVRVLADQRVRRHLDERLERSQPDRIARLVARSLAHGPLLSARRIPSRPGVREPRGRT